MADVETQRDLSNGLGDVSPPNTTSNGSSTNGSSDPIDSQADPRKLFVGGIPYDAVAQDLLNYFERYGPIREAVVIRDKNNPLQNQGYGFVIFEDPRVAQWVLNAEKNPIIKGRKANVQKGHKRAGLPSSTNGYHLTTEAASVLPSFYYAAEPLGVLDARDATASGLLSLNQMSWPLTNDRLLAAAGAYTNGYSYGAAQGLGHVQDQPLHWAHSLLLQHQQQQQQQQHQQQQQQQANSVFLPQAGVILPTQLSPASSSYAAAAVAAAAAAGISPSSSWANGGLVHSNNAFNLLGTAAFVPAATSANAINAFAAAAAAGQQQVNGLVAAPTLYASATQNGTATNPHALWPEVSPSDASLVTYVASPPHTPPAGITSLTHIVEQSNGIA